MCFLSGFQVFFEILLLQGLGMWDFSRPRSSSGFPLTPAGSGG
jgi:hypothetical protein